MRRKYSFEIVELKKIVYDVIGKEIIKYNIDFNVFPVTFFEYWNQFLRGKKFKLIWLGEYFKSKAFRDGDGNVVLFVDKLNRIGDFGQNVFMILLACYHEVYHFVQKDFDSYSYNGFVCDMDFYLKSKSIRDYGIFHDEYAFEIGANLYGVSMAREYLIKNYPVIYEENKDYIEAIEKLYIRDYLGYDLVDVIERFIEYRKKKYKRIVSFAAHPLMLEVGMIEDYSIVVDIFLKLDGTFRCIADIISSEEFKRLDRKIVSAFFSCKYFLESIDIDGLSLEELRVVSNALEYANSVFCNQCLFLGDFVDNKSRFDRARSNVSKRLELVKCSLDKSRNLLNNSWECNNGKRF